MWSYIGLETGSTTTDNLIADKTIIRRIANGMVEVGEDYVAAAGMLQYASGEKEI